jgi:uncharacterized protein YbaA (DUF1428 family)
MSYIDGFVVPVPTQKKDAYRKMASEAWPMFKEYGALRLVECWGDDTPTGKVTDFPGSVKLKEGETVVFSWIVWPSKEVRDAGNKKMMDDPRMKDLTDVPFDMQRMIMGGFVPIVDSTGELTK